MDPRVGLNQQEKMKNKAKIRPTRKEAQQWADALRSGKYKQTTGQLQNAKGHCCLGVACDIFIPKQKQVRNAKGYLSGSMPDEQEEAPQWLRDMNILFDKDEVSISFTKLNDVKKFTFDEIADIIELIFVHKMVG